MPEIATLAARIAIEGAQQATAGLRGVRSELDGVAVSARGMGDQQAELAQRISSTVAASVNETTILRAKESSLAALAARYVEASAELQDWTSKNGAANVQAVEQQAALDRMALSIQREAASLRELEEAGSQPGGFGGMKDAISGLAGELGGVFNMGGIAGLLTGGLGVASIAAVGKAVIDLGNTTADNIAQITNLSQRVGMGREDFTRFAEAADDASISMRGVGVSYQQVGSALETFQNNIGRGQLALDGFNVKGGAAKAAFEALGVSLEDAGGKSRGMTDILMDTADAMVKMGDGAERTALAKRLGLYDLLPILEKGRDGVREMMGAVDTSLVPSAEAEKAAIRLKTAEDNLDDSMRGLKQTIGVEVVPALAGLTEQVNYALKGYKDLSDEGSRLPIGLERLAASWRMMTTDLVAHGRALEDSKTKTEIWADAYADATSRASVAVSGFAVDQERIKIAMQQTQTAMGDYDPVAAQIALRNQEMQNTMAAWEQTAKDTKDRVDALFGSVSRPLPDLSKPQAKVEAASNLLSGKTTIKQLEGDAIGSAINTAVAAGGNYKELIGVEKDLANGAIDIATAMRRIIDIAPSGADNKIAKYFKDLQDVLDATGKSDSFVANMAANTQVVNRFVKGTQEGAADYAKAVSKLEDDKKRLEKNIGAVATWDATKSWPADQTPAKMEAERLAIEAQIKKDEETLARAKRVKEGYWTTVTEFKGTPTFADKSPSKSMVAHHDKFDPASIDVTNYKTAGAKADEAIAKGITDNTKLATDAVSSVMMGAYGWTQTPEYDSMWHGAGTRAVSGIENGIRQEGWRINDAVMNQLTGIMPNIVRAVIDAMKRG